MTQNIQKEILLFGSHHFMANRWGNNGNRKTIFLGSKTTADGESIMKLKDACSFEEKL